jgi:hypothetical protein
MISSKRDVPTRRILAWVALGLTFVLLVWAATAYLPVGIDWHLTFRPSALALLTSTSPYAATPLAPYAGAPWGLWVLLPLAILPEPIGRAALLLLGLGALAFSARRLGARRLTMVVFLLSPPVLHALLNANLDWMPVLGFVLPPPIGLFFLAIKPQMGSAVALFWLAEAWRRGRWREVLKVFGPVTLALGLSLLLYGPWPLNAFYIYNSSQGWNASLWPESIPIGLGLVWAALHKREIRFAMAASPCLSPYVLFHSWTGAVASIVGLPGETLAAVAGLWILVFIRAM